MQGQIKAKALARGLGGQTGIKSDGILGRHIALETVSVDMGQAAFEVCLGRQEAD